MPELHVDPTCESNVFYLRSCNGKLQVNVNKTNTYHSIISWMELQRLVEDFWISVNCCCFCWWCDKLCFTLSRFVELPLWKSVFSYFRSWHLRTCASGGHIIKRVWVAWPSGLRRWFKAPVSSEAWVRIPPLPQEVLWDHPHYKEVSWVEFEKKTGNVPKCR